MNIEIKSVHGGPVVAAVTVDGPVTLSKVFSGVGIRTEDGLCFGIAQRDTGLEIRCPDGALIGIKVSLPSGETYIEDNNNQEVPG